MTPAAQIVSLQWVSHEPVRIADLSPTQITVGLREVDIKRKRWRERDTEHPADFLRTHPVPVVVGPENRYFIVDRHHLTRALQDEGVTSVFVSIVGSKNQIAIAEFWTVLEAQGWAHPFDSDGKRWSHENMPKSICALIDDPYRSLAGALKRAGAYVKDKAPFSEFRWADYLRTRIARDVVESEFDRAFAIAFELARSHETAGLPGWKGAEAH